MGAHLELVSEDSAHSDRPTNGRKPQHFVSSPPSDKMQQLINKQLGVAGGCLVYNLQMEVKRFQKVWNPELLALF